MRECVRECVNDFAVCQSGEALEEKKKKKLNVDVVAPRVMSTPIFVSMAMQAHTLLFLFF